CGRSHMPDPKALSDRMTLGSALSAVIAVGLRPCSGAIVVLTFGLVNGLYLGGILSVFAMAFGTAITVSAIASLAVFVKGTALRFGGDGARGRWIGAGLEIAGALFLMLVGLLLLGGALQTV
ncbi:MAG: delayed-early response protein/equilibrative nucleoside transporter, partial [Aurantimonas coralicida]|nr:delayed-early response protein/equilibrative nucleoside transporter [Aurantimonas coralicida]